MYTTILYILLRIATENEIFQSTVALLILKIKNSYEFQLLSELNKDDPDRGMRLCEIMHDL